MMDGSGPENLQDFVEKRELSSIGFPSFVEMDTHEDGFLKFQVGM